MPTKFQDVLLFTCRVTHGLWSSPRFLEVWDPAESAQTAQAPVSRLKALNSWSSYTTRGGRLVLYSRP